MALFDVDQLIVAALVMFAGSSVLSTVGFGIGMSTTPVLLFVLDPQTIVVVGNTVSLVLFVLVIVQTRGSMPVRDMVPVSVAGLMGVPVGVFALTAAGTGVLRISMTALILLLTLAVVFNFRGPIPRVRIVGPIVGFVVGMLLAALGIGGPLLVLFLLTRDWPRHAMRASLGLYFLVVESAAAIGYGVAGLFTAERISLILVVFVPVLLGFVIGTMLVRRMDDRVFRHAVLLVIVTTSVMVLVRELVQL